MHQARRAEEQQVKTVGRPQQREDLQRGRHRQDAGHHRSGDRVGRHLERLAIVAGPAEARRQPVDHQREQEDRAHRQDEEQQRRDRNIQKRRAVKLPARLDAEKRQRHDNRRSGNKRQRRDIGQRQPRRRHLLAVDNGPLGGRRNQQVRHPPQARHHAPPLLDMLRD